MANSHTIESWQQQQQTTKFNSELVSHLIGLQLKTTNHFKLKKPQQLNDNRLQSTTSIKQNRQFYIQRRHTSGWHYRKVPIQSHSYKYKFPTFHQLFAGLCLKTINNPHNLLACNNKFWTNLTLSHNPLHQPLFNSVLTYTGWAKLSDTTLHFCL